VVCDLAAVRIEDQIMRQRGQRKITLQLDPLIDRRRGGRENFDDDQRVVDDDGVGGRRRADDERVGDEGAVGADADGRAVRLGAAGQARDPDGLIEGDIGPALHRDM